LIYVCVYKKIFCLKILSLLHSHQYLHRDKLQLELANSTEGKEIITCKVNAMQYRLKYPTVN